MPATCPSNDQLDGFLAGRIPASEQESLGSHIASCDSCQQHLNLLLALPLADRSAPGLDEGWNGELARRFADRLFDQANIVHRSDEPHPEIPGCEVRRLLGQGGMGKVYLAWQESLQRLVAVKVLPARATADARARARFTREIAAAGRVNHPGIVKAYSAAQQNDQHYLLMEYVEGKDLSCIVRRKGPLELVDACEIVRQAALALQAAHERGLVHRDIKPSNLMLTPDGVVKVLDLGLARIHLEDDDGQKLTYSGQIMGTIDYMAPEQGDHAGTVDIRSDIFSLGATLFKLLTGTAPLAATDGASPVQKLTALALGRLPSIADVRKDLPAKLIPVIDRMLAHNAKLRFATPIEVAQELKPFCSGHGLTSQFDSAKETGAVSLQDTAEALPTIDTSGPDRTTDLQGSHTTKWMWHSLVVGSALAAIFGSAGLYLLFGGGDPRGDSVGDQSHEADGRQNDQEATDIDNVDDPPETPDGEPDTFPPGDDVAFATTFLGEGRHLTVVAGDKSYGGVGSLLHDMPKEPFKITDVYFMSAAPDTTDEDLQALADARLARLESVTFHKQPLITTGGLTLLAEAYPNLKHLNIGGLTCWEPGQPGGIAAEDVLPILIEFQQLESIRVHIAPRTPDPVSWAAGIAQIKSLRRVELEGEANGAMLQCVARLPQLEELLIANAALADDDFNPLSEMEELRELTLVRTGGFTPHGLARLESAPHLESVSFTINNNRFRLPKGIAREDIAALAKRMPNCRFTFADAGEVVKFGGDSQ